MPFLENAWNWSLLILGFGFVIFWHELGHFLAAKWVGIKVEQFAVGFGQAIVAWRKGIGLRVGTTQREYDRRVLRHVADRDPEALKYKERVGVLPTDVVDKAAAELGLGETEYRWNWIPLGGYVKMLGQDDLKPGVTVDDPRAYNRKSVGARMLVVSAGVVMNVILAAIAFMIVFRVGLNAPAPVAGGVLVGSPAQQAGIEPGDTILTLDGAPQYDFKKIYLTTALAEQGAGMPVTFRKPDGRVVETTVVPERADDDPRSFLAIGVSQPWTLAGVRDARAHAAVAAQMTDMYPDVPVLRPGERIAAVDGRAMPGPTAVAAFNAALVDARGRPVTLTIADDATGATRTAALAPSFQGAFRQAVPLNFAGMVPRTAIGTIFDGSPAKGKLRPGDVVLWVGTDQDRIPHVPPAVGEFSAFTRGAGENNHPITVGVLRDGRELVVGPMHPVRLPDSRVRGLSIAADYELSAPVVSAVLPNSLAEFAGVRRGARLTAVNDVPVTNWFDVHFALTAVTPGDDVTIDADLDGRRHRYTIPAVSDEQVAGFNGNRLSVPDAFARLSVAPWMELRKTGSLLTAAKWGVTETRDAVMQVYLTIRRMAEQSVSYKNMSGPLGIFHAGYQFSQRGPIDLLWFLAIISANLAVMNFLPIPIVDGGLFLFLIIEKLKGGPISPRVQAVAQVVGLAILLSVFVLATYQDILRML